MREVYTYSSKAIKRRVYYSIILVFVMLFSMIVAIWKRNGLNQIANENGMLTSIITIAIVLILEVAVVNYVMFKKLKTNELEIKEDYFIRFSGKEREMVQYSRVIKFIEEKLPSGEVARIRIKTSYSSINIIEFEQMEEISNHITTRLSDDCEVITKQRKVNWSSPWMLILIGMIAVVAINFADGLNHYITGLLYKIFIVGLGVSFIWLRPVSKNSGERFRGFEVFMGVLLVVIGVINVLIHVI